MSSSDWLDISKLESLGVDVAAVFHSTPEHYRDFYIVQYSAHLRFCPTCVRRGFHTYIFQDTRVSRCPIHQIPIEDECPQCGKSIAYALNASVLRNPYGCRCGYLLWPERDELIWRGALSEADERILADYPKHVRVLWSLSEIICAINHAFKKNIGAGAPEPPHYQHNINFLPSALDIPEWPADTFSEAPTTTGNMKRLISRLPVSKRSTADLMHVRVQLMESIKARLYATYKSTRRHVAKLVGKYHEPCMSALAGLPLLARRHATPFVCPWAATYLAWKERWGENNSGVAQQRTGSWNLIICNRLAQIVDDVLHADHLPSYESEEMVEWLVSRCQIAIGERLLESFIETHRLVADSNYNMMLAPYSALDDYFFYGAANFSLIDLTRYFHTKRELEELISFRCTEDTHYRSVRAIVANIHAINTTYLRNRKSNIAPGSHAGMKYELFLRSALLRIHSQEYGRFPP